MFFNKHESEYVQQKALAYIFSQYSPLWKIIRRILNMSELENIMQGSTAKFVERVQILISSEEENFVKFGLCHPPSHFETSIESKQNTENSGMGSQNCC